MLLVVEEPLADGAPRIRRDVEHGSRVRRSRRDDDGVLERSVLFQSVGHLSYGRLLLTDRHVDTDQSFALLVDDRVQSDGGLARLAVADDQLALSPPDRDHRVDCLDARLNRFLDRLPVDDAGRNTFERVRLGGLDRALVIQGTPQRVDDAPDQGGSDRYLDDPAGPAHLLAFPDFLTLAQEHHADLVLFEIERQTVDVVAEVDELSRHDSVQAIEARDSISDGEDRADLGDVDRLFVVGELLLQDCRDFVCFDLHVRLPSFLPPAPGSAGLRLPPIRQTPATPRGR